MNQNNRAKKKRPFPKIILLVLLLGGAFLLFFSSRRTLVADMGPIIAGKPTVYRLEHVPNRSPRDALDPDNPLEKAGPEIIPYLINALHGDYGSKGNLVNGLGGLFYRLSPSGLQQHLREPIARVVTIQGFAASRLGRFGTNAAVAVPAMTELYKSWTWRNAGREAIIVALGKIGPPAAESIPALLSSLSETNGPTGWTDARPGFLIVTSMMQMGHVPSEATNLLDSLEKKGGNPAGAASVAAWMSHPTPESLERIHVNLEIGPDVFLRAGTARALEFPNKLPKSTIQKLRPLLADASLFVQQGAAMALARHGDEQDRSRALLVLTNGVTLPMGFRALCVESLGSMGPRAKEALPMLRATLAKEYQPELKWALEEAIRKIESAPESE